MLDGVSRQVVIEIGERPGIPLRQTTVTLDDALQAEESFFTSTRLCICPVRWLNGKQPGLIVPDAVTQAITEAFKQEVEFDFVQQYLNFLSESADATGL